MEGTEDNKNKEESMKKKKVEEIIYPNKECKNIINFHDYYEILGVKKGTNEEELKKS